MDQEEEEEVQQQQLRASRDNSTEGEDSSNVEANDYPLVEGKTQDPHLHPQAALRLYDSPHQVPNRGLH